jgi:hypothetical protein
MSIQNKLILPHNAVIVENKYIVGYMGFIYDVIYCFNKNDFNSTTTIDISWNEYIIGKTFESNTFEYKKHYGFHCGNTIKDVEECNAGSSFLTEHIIKVFMPIETVFYEQQYGKYDYYWSKTIIVKEISF